MTWIFFRTLLTLLAIPGGILLVAALLLAVPVHCAVWGYINDDFQGDGSFAIRWGWFIVTLTGTTHGGLTLRILGIPVPLPPDLLPFPDPDKPPKKTSPEKEARREAARERKKQKKERKKRARARAITTARAKGRPTDHLEPYPPCKRLRILATEGWNLLKSLYRCLRLHGSLNGSAGFDDPARTGQLHGLLAMVYGLKQGLPPPATRAGGKRGLTVNITPDYVNTRLAMGGAFSMAVIPLQAVVITARLLLKKRVRHALLVNPIPSKYWSETDNGNHQAAAATR